MTLLTVFKQFKKFQDAGKSVARSLSIKDDQESKKTCLYDLHIENNGKMVNFSGWLLPIQYRDSITASHQHTRTHASLFDVGHMLQSHVSGCDSGEFLESLTTADLQNLAQGGAALTVFTNKSGGILDDLIITKDRNDRFFVVSNAGRRNEDIELMLGRQAEMKSQGKNVTIEFLDPLEQGLIALQGPSAATTLQTLVKIDLTKLKFMNSVETKINQKSVRISRCGYTGEDGFEISVNGKDARTISEMILEVPDIKLAGLGARDSLRLEAGFCLYGHDINESITPVEASLQWLIAKRRREAANFPGAEFILEQIKNGPKKKRVGLILGQGPPARENATILTSAGERVGIVTSGGPSPTLGKPIAMGYVPLEHVHTGTPVLTEIRGKTYKALITKMPFVKPHYYSDKR
ncbi:PREDICTED: aminomethyltransferase, mitochondrial [Ceratosolen solmsi marchali]|uniref:Aminomethyltransferase n=1 Tax=Ceratosolen solmsi marchali TaxID=326594 RepID=A0AAJ6YCV6_9HYME|nr:PREDICTED: aminomethyltransferase, mitochondrial [Ceratosolen solmsi marchali]XP_011495364.1 PREDICTED: aminomethyltransferase, mitochondrial [Ceratosolen solmsi marchali]